MVSDIFSFLPFFFGVVVAENFIFFYLSCETRKKKKRKIP
tara:strand:+ start:1723 stop:1842 length:120 start_codon:yes stop_codon:yes gene_type:complete